MRTIELRDDGLYILDQTLLPVEERYVRVDTTDQMAEAIRSLRVRGAPLIGVSAAWGLYLCASALRNASPEAFAEGVHSGARALAATRPTAVNLFWALERARRAILDALPSGVSRAVETAKHIAAHMQLEDEQTCARLSEHGAALLSSGGGVLTHCNAGALATCGMGTALGVIRAAWRAGVALHVYADETRPLLQGARLTAWELAADGVPVTLACDNMAAMLMQRGLIRHVVVGADRIAANGDTANKIGTYGVATLAHAHGIPFYIAAPTSTIDTALPCGEQIPIEFRARDEVRNFFGVRTAPEIDAYNPAFDVTPARLIGAIITEKGVLYPPYEVSIANACKT